jgi:hypothetical protein
MRTNSIAPTAAPAYVKVAYFITRMNAIYR